MPRDTAYAIRQLRKSPVFASAAILTLALGIGANTAIYQVLDALVFRSLAVRDPAALVRVQLFEGARPRAFSYAEYRALAERQRAASGMLATSDFPLHAAILRGRGQARTTNAVLVTADYFQVLGVEAAAGRVFTAADDRAPVVIISDAFWAREFGRSPGALGQTLQINKAIVSVIGVAPPEFSGETPGNAPDAWAPMGTAPQLMSSDWLGIPKSWLNVIARLRPGETAAAARQEFEDAWRQSGHPTGRLALEPAGHGLGDLRARFESPALVLMGAVALLLLIACSNLATLLVGRAAARSHEISVRLALGAGRARVARQLLTESLALAASGAGLGLVLANWASRALAARAAGMARIPVEWNWRVFAFTAGATLAATLIAGLAPALSAVRPPTRRGAAPASRRLGRTLIVAQIALSMVLLSVAGMLTRSLWNLRHQDFGYHPDRLVVADLPWEFSPAMMARYAAVYQPLLDRMEALPDIRFFALCGFGPLSQAGQHTGPFAAPGGAAAGMRIVHVSARFFETAGIPITAGRGITDDDRAPSPRVAVLSETAARELFGRDNPVGRSISDTQAYDPLRAMEVAGVARDVRFAGPTEPHTAVVYVAMPQFPAPITSAMARAGGDPGRAAANLRAAIHSVDPDLAVSSVRGAAEIIDSQLGRERVLAFVASGFALLALALTGIGVYGLVSYAVEQRTREIGIRAALGARQGQIVGMIVGELAIAAGSSAALGVVGAVATGQAIRGVLFGTAEDSRAVAGAALLLVIVGAMAAWLPARRAARRDPVAALRQD